MTGMTLWADFGLGLVVTCDQDRESARPGRGRVPGSDEPSVGGTGISSSSRPGSLGTGFGAEFVWGCFGLVGTFLPWLFEEPPDGLLAGP
ncbi:uncharacterized protein N7458_005116 [Penicillium daleae]|uniref:Uncharacterized protein n=1 Tax=Penicillium daleae TaxID=63821 RepID=A0AAD6C961_9EURO|nr:uncharacterized protein N7458_005116 [Penicillium daleae]KAJ5454160.1 hypothetical protein N7458_005116 [Penicillium daleae]